MKREKTSLETPARERASVRLTSAPLTRALKGNPLRCTDAMTSPARGWTVCVLKDVIFYDEYPKLISAVNLLILNAEFFIHKRKWLKSLLFSLKCDFLVSSENRFFDALDNFSRIMLFYFCIFLYRSYHNLMYANPELLSYLFLFLTFLIFMIIVFSPYFYDYSFFCSYLYDCCFFLSLFL